MRKEEKERDFGVMLFLVYWGHCWIIREMHSWIWSIWDGDGRLMIPLDGIGGER